MTVASSQVGETVLFATRTTAALGRAGSSASSTRQGRRPRKRSALVGGGAAEYMDGWTSDSDPSALWADSTRGTEVWPTEPRGGGSNDQRYFVVRAPGVDMIALNTRRATFRDVRMRRAVNYALDRPALAGVYSEQPVDRYIPPAVAVLSRTRSPRPWSDPHQGRDATGSPPKSARCSLRVR